MAGSASSSSTRCPRCLAPLLEWARRRLDQPLSTSALAPRASLQAEADARGELDWRVSVDLTIARVHQHGATAARGLSGRPRTEGARPNDHDPQLRRDEPDDHSIGRSRGGLTTNDIEDYEQRNVVERFFNRMQNRRRLASRYDEHALVH
jgi:hypothetical protein